MNSLLLISSLTSLAAAFCGHGTFLHPRDLSAPVSTFGYDGINGPLGWYGLNTTSNAACALGRHQSPINIVMANHTKIEASNLNLTFDDYPSGAEIENLGTTLEVFINGSMTIDVKQYKLKQFHFHGPSEHHFSHEVFPMEAHFVFQAGDASLSVVGFPIQLGSSSQLLQSVFAHVDDVAAPGSQGRTGGFTFKGTGLARRLAFSQYIRYSGSLTTPPCTEGVIWSLVLQPLYIDPATYTKVKRIMPYNARYTQNSLGDINLLDAARESLDQEAL